MNQSQHDAAIYTLGACPDLRQIVLFSGEHRVGRSCLLARLTFQYALHTPTGAKMAMLTHEVNKEAWECLQKLASEVNDCQVTKTTVTLANGTTVRLVRDHRELRGHSMHLVAIDDFSWHPEGARGTADACLATARAEGSGLLIVASVKRMDEPCRTQVLYGDSQNQPNTLGVFLTR